MPLLTAQKPGCDYPSIRYCLCWCGDVVAASFAGDAEGVQAFWWDINMLALASRMKSE
jgi:hypothetical protein